MDVTDLFKNKPKEPPVSDAARRITDQMNSRLTFQPFAVGQWMAFKLDDGTTDGVLYEKKTECIDHQYDETRCIYMMVRPDLYNPHEVDRVLTITRRAYAAGLRTVKDA